MKKGIQRIEFDEFQCLPVEEVARLMREAGPKVCVFPINGTRRWFMLEHDLQPGEDFVSAYLVRSAKRHIELYKMLFDHGIDTLLTPVLGPDILEREKREELIERGLTAWFGQNPDFLDFYGSYDVRVHVYGDARRYLQNTPYAHVLDAFDEIAQHTATHRRHRLFFGVCAHDPVETRSGRAIASTARPPQRRCHHRTSGANRELVSDSIMERSGAAPASNCRPSWGGEAATW